MDRKSYVVILHYLPSTDFSIQLTASYPGTRGFFFSRWGRSRVAKRRAALLSLTNVSRRWRARRPLASRVTASKRLSDRNKHLWSINVCTKGPPEQFPNQKPGFLEVYVAASVSSDQIGQPRSELIPGEEQRLNRKKKK